MMGDDSYDPEETPNHHLPRMMSDLDNPSGHRHHPRHLPNMADMDNPSGHHHPLARMSDLDKHSGHHHLPPMTPDLDNHSDHHPHHQNNPRRPPHHHHGKPVHLQPQPPPLDEPHFPHPKPRHHNHSPPPHHHHHHSSGRSSKASSFAAIATLLLLLALTSLILYLLYRPDTPHFSIVSASVYLLNTTTTTPSFLAASIQFTIITRNPHRRTSLYYDHLSAIVYYRDQPITPPAVLPPLFHLHHSTVVFSPILGEGEPLPVAPGVVEELLADESYGIMRLRLVLMGRLTYKAGFIWTAHYGVYVGCDLIVGVKKEVVGAVPLLANPDCKVDV